MDKSDISFKVGLDTSPAEQQMERLGEKLRNAPFAKQIFNTPMRNSGWDNMTYPSSNNYGVPSTQVLERSLAVTMSSLDKFARALEMISLRMVNFQMVGGPHTPSSTIYAPNNIAGYLPSSTTSNPRPWFPTEHYTREQADSINYRVNHNDIFNELLYRRKSNPYSATYDIFNNIHSPTGAMGMFAIWSSLFNKKTPLGIGAPTTTDSGADGIDTPAEQGKDIVEQEKKDNEELKEKLLLWGKISATIYAIRKVISGLAKLWKFGAETASGVNSNLNEEHGFFSIDPEGAIRANTDKTRAIMYAGVRNMGANAPVSKSGLDYASSKMTEMWTAAMSGRNVDARTTIDVQRLKDFFGIDLSVAGLLTGEREGKTATDIQIDMMDKVEKQISKLAEADEITKGQVIDSLKNILGDELVNAIVANANKNLKIDATDLKLTLAERIMQHGDSAIPSGNLTESTEKVITSLSAFNKAVQDLKNTVTTELGPIFSSLITSITGVVNWVNKKINRVAGTKNAVGEIDFKTSVASLTNDYNAYGYYKQSENDKNDVFKNKVDRINKDLKSKSIYDKVEAMYLAQVEAESAADIENLGIKATQDVIGQHIIEGRLDENSSNPVERALAKYTWGGFKGYEAFKQQMASDPNATWASAQMKELFWNPQNLNETGRIRAYHDFLKNNPETKKAFISAFDKGGVLDFSSGMNIGKYLLNQAFYSSGEEYLKFWKEMGTQSHEVLDNTYNIETEWNDKDKNGRVDFGEVEVTLVVRDINGTIISKQNLQGAVQ